MLGTTRRAALEAEYFSPPHHVALTGRLESEGGRHNDTATVGAVSYYPPMKIHGLIRLTAELTERRGQRSIALYVRGQF